MTYRYRSWARSKRRVRSTMRKTYLPIDQGAGRASNVRRVFSADPLGTTLERSSERLDFLQLQEPNLIFGGNHRCVDPKTGLGAFGPYRERKTGVARRGQLCVGIVGPAEAIEKTLAYLEKISRP